MRLAKNEYNIFKCIEFGMGKQQTDKCRLKTRKNKIK